MVAENGSWWPEAGDLVAEGERRSKAWFDALRGAAKAHYDVPKLGLVYADVEQGKLVAKLWSDGEWRNTALAPVETYALRDGGKSLSDDEVEALQKGPVDKSLVRIVELPGEAARVEYLSK